MKTQTSDQQSKGSTNNKKSNIYPEYQLQEMYRCIHLRQAEAEAHVRKKASFKDVARHLEGQLAGRSYEVLKTKVNKLLMPGAKGRASLLQVPFFRDAMLQALSAGHAASAGDRLGCGSIADLDTRDSSDASLGKRSPFACDSMSQFMYPYQPQYFEGFGMNDFYLEQPVEAESSDLSVIGNCLQADASYRPRRTTDLRKPFGIEEFNNLGSLKSSENFKEQTLEDDGAELILNLGEHLIGEEPLSIDKDYDERFFTREQQDNSF